MYAIFSMIMMATSAAWVFGDAIKIKSDIVIDQKSQLISRNFTLYIGALNSYLDANVYSGAVSISSGTSIADASLSFPAGYTKALAWSNVYDGSKFWAYTPIISTSKTGSYGNSSLRTNSMQRGFESELEKLGVTCGLVTSSGVATMVGSTNAIPTSIPVGAIVVLLP